MTGVLIRSCGNTDTQGGCHVTEAKTGVMVLQAKELRGPLDSKRQRNDCPLEPSEEAHSCFILDF